MTTEFEDFREGLSTPSTPECSEFWLPGSIRPSGEDEQTESDRVSIEGGGSITEAMQNEQRLHTPPNQHLHSVLNNVGPDCDVYCCNCVCKTTDKESTKMTESNLTLKVEGNVEPAEESTCGPSCLPMIHQLGNDNETTDVIPIETITTTVNGETIIQFREIAEDPTTPEKGVCNISCINGGCVSLTESPKVNGSCRTSEEIISDADSSCNMSCLTGNRRGADTETMEVIPLETITTNVNEESIVRAQEIEPPSPKLNCFQRYRKLKTDFSISCLTESHTHLDTNDTMQSNLKLETDQNVGEPPSSCNSIHNAARDSENSEDVRINLPNESAVDIPDTEKELQKPATRNFITTCFLWATKHSTDKQLPNTVEVNKNKIANDDKHLPKQPHFLEVYWKIIEYPTTTCRENNPNSAFKFLHKVLWLVIMLSAIFDSLEATKNQIFRIKNDESDIQKKEANFIGLGYVVSQLFLKIFFGIVAATKSEVLKEAIKNLKPVHFKMIPTISFAASVSLSVTCVVGGFGILSLSKWSIHDLNYYHYEDVYNSIMVWSPIHDRPETESAILFYGLSSFGYIKQFSTRVTEFSIEIFFLLIAISFYLEVKQTPKLMSDFKKKLKQWNENRTSEMKIVELEGVHTNQNEQVNQDETKEDGKAVLAENNEQTAKPMKQVVREVQNTLSQPCETNDTVATQEGIKCQENNKVKQLELKTKLTQHEENDGNAEECKMNASEHLENENVTQLDENEHNVKPSEIQNDTKALLDLGKCLLKEYDNQKQLTLEINKPLIIMFFFLHCTNMGLLVYWGYFTFFNFEAGTVTWMTIELAVAAVAYSVALFVAVMASEYRPWIRSKATREVLQMGTAEMIAMLDEIADTPIGIGSGVLYINFSFILSFFSGAGTCFAVLFRAHSV